MQYKQLGRTGIRVSEVGFGCEGFEKATPEQTEAIVDTAMEQGMNILDLFASNPRVRTNLGNALAKYQRSSWVVQGHLGTAWENGQYVRTRDLEKIKTAFEDLLDRLQTGYVDVGMIHYIDDNEDFDAVFGGEIIKYALRLKATGKVRCIGISTHNTDIARRAVESNLVDVIMFSVNPAYDMLPPIDDIMSMFEDNAFRDVTYGGIDPKRAKLYHLCQDSGVALTVMKGLAAGILLEAKTSPFKQALTPVQCIHYALSRPGVASVLVGVADPDQVLAAAAYSSATDAEKDYGEILANAPKIAFTGQCMYCGHCAPCPEGIDVASVNKYLDLALIRDYVPVTVREHYDGLEHHAGECLACGSCVQNCPFGVDVIDKMSQAVRMFGR